MEESYYPAIVLGHFNSTHEALASLDASAAQAAVLLRTMDACPNRFVTVYAEMEHAVTTGPDREAISIERCRDGRVRLYLGWPHVRSQSKGKILAIAREILANDPVQSQAQDAPELVALRWRGITPVVRTSGGSGPFAMTI
ncbi:hypothetical protein [Burkholderia anthina]|uniref:hypothetical protein n=1 Tax=Burkholderia anthina TaxID=179879 RepID=UPI00158F58C1|nr:hypothetical protein [Burkholderia anthina]